MKKRSQYEELSKKISKLSNLNSDHPINHQGLESARNVVIQKKRLVNESNQRKHVAVKIILDNLNGKKFYSAKVFLKQK